MCMILLMLMIMLHADACSLLMSDSEPTRGAMSIGITCGNLESCSYIMFIICYMLSICASVCKRMLMILSLIMSSHDGGDAEKFSGPNDVASGKPRARAAPHAIVEGVLRRRTTGSTFPSSYSDGSLWPYDSSVDPTSGPP